MEQLQSDLLSTEVMGRLSSCLRRCAGTTVGVKLAEVLCAVAAAETVDELLAECILLLVLQSIAMVRTSTCSNTGLTTVDCTCTLTLLECTNELC